MFSAIKRRSSCLLRQSVIRPKLLSGNVSINQFRYFASKPIVGIDFGGNSSSVAYHDGSSCKVLTNSEGARTTPSVVSYIKIKDGKIEELVGNAGKRQVNTNPKSTFYNFKTLLGRDFNDEETQELIKESDYSFGIKEITDNETTNLGLFCESTKEVKTPQEISSVIMTKMKSTAEGYINDKVNDCIVTVPPYFTETQREALIESCKLAGLRVKGTINDAEAAALAHNIGKINVDIAKHMQSQSGGDNKNDENSKEKKANVGKGVSDKPGTLCAVYDLGGSTFSFTILRIDDSGGLETVSNASSLHLGGNKFDDLLVKYICDEFKKDTDCDLTNDPLSLQRVRDTAEKSKIELSHSHSVNVNIPFVTADATGPKHIDFNLTRAKYEMLSSKLMNDTLPFVNNALKEANIEDASSVQHVLLCGGMARTPKIQDIVCKHFKQSASVLAKKYETVVGDVANDELQSYGAAIYGYWLNNCGAASAGVDGEDGENIREGGDDSIPLAIGVEIAGGQFYKIFDKNTTFPCEEKEIFTIAYNGQSTINLRFWQGNPNTLLISHIETEVEEDKPEDETDETDETDEADDNDDEVDETDENEDNEDNEDDIADEDEDVDDQVDDVDDVDENENQGKHTKIESSHNFLGEMTLNCNFKHNGLVKNNVCIEVTFTIDQFGNLQVQAEDITEYESIDCEQIGEHTESVLFGSKTADFGDVLNNLSQEELNEYFAQSGKLKEKFVGNIDLNLLDMERHYYNNKCDLIIWQSEIQIAQYSNYLNENNIRLKNEILTTVETLRQLRIASDSDKKDSECPVVEFAKQINELAILNEQLNDFLFGFVDPSQTGTGGIDGQEIEDENVDVDGDDEEFDDNEDEDDTTEQEKSKTW